MEKPYKGIKILVILYLISVTLSGLLLWVTYSLVRYERYVQAVLLPYLR